LEFIEKTNTTLNIRFIYLLKCNNFAKLKVNLMYVI